MKGAGLLMRELSSRANKKKILVVSLLIISVVAILFSFIRPQNSNVTVKIQVYNDSYILFNYPNWLSLNNTEHQIIKINKNDDLIIVWKFPPAGESLNLYVDNLVSHNFGRFNYTTQSSKVVKKNNLEWHLNCGSGVSMSGRSIKDCYAITQCDSVYIIQATTLKSTSLPKEAFNEIVNSFVCLRD